MKQLFAFTLLLFCLLHCHEKKFSLALCKDLGENECIPPLIDNEVVYYINKPRTAGSVKSYLDGIYFDGPTLSFHLKNLDLFEEKKTNWKRDFSASYNFVGQKDSYEMARIDYLSNSILGLNQVAEIYLNYYAETKEQPYRKLEPIQVRYEFFLKQKRFAFRTVSIILKNEE